MFRFVVTKWYITIKSIYTILTLHSAKKNNLIVMGGE